MSLRTSLKKNAYMAGHFLSYALTPRWIYSRRLNNLLNDLTDEEKQLVAARVDYYNRLTRPTAINNTFTVGDFHFPYSQKRRFTFYFFDIYEVVRYFPKQLRFCFLPGDVTHVPDCPTFVKSRPIQGNNSNSVILKLNKRRHFGWLVKNDKPFSEKKNMMVARSTWAGASPQRRKLYADYWNHPMCDVGKIQMEQNEDMPQTVKPFLSVAQQLDYKFIACIEGVDVATNLKWVMSSNSVAVSPPMKYETWFMEGCLKPGYHYIEVKPDFSDLIEKLQYYIDHPNEAEAIIGHAHEWVDQFRDKRLERATQLAVAQHYFDMTNGA